MKNTTRSLAIIAAMGAISCGPYVKVQTAYDNQYKINLSKSAILFDGPSSEHLDKKKFLETLYSQITQKLETKNVIINRFNNSEVELNKQTLDQYVSTNELNSIATFFITKITSNAAGDPWNITMQVTVYDAGDKKEKFKSEIRVGIDLPEFGATERISKHFAEALIKELEKNNIISH